MNELDIGQIQCLAKPIFQKRPDVFRVELVGSWSKGTQTPCSDIDFLVEIDPHSTFSIMDIIDLQSELEQVLGREVDIVDRTTITQPHLLASFLASTNIPIVGD
jgi:hypothetical protein